ncbi:MAG: hypothetical protein J5792_08050, partial [Bacteroidales bacterium]|nr:hypothetical protein [Bacteroidales bacterium]
MASRLGTAMGLLFFATALSAQVEPLYFLRSNNARMQYNPGLPARQKFHLGIGTGNFAFSLNTGPLTYNNLFVQGEDGYKYINVEQLIYALKQPKEQTGRLEFRTEVLNFGLAIGNTSAGVSLQLRSDAAVRMPGEAFAYLL